MGAGVKCEACGLNTVRIFSPNVNLSSPPSQWYDDKCICGWVKRGLKSYDMPREESFAEAFERLNPGIKAPQRKGPKTFDEMVTSNTEVREP